MTRRYAQGGKKGGAWAGDSEPAKGEWVDGLYESNQHLRERKRLRMLPEVEKQVKLLWAWHDDAATLCPRLCTVACPRGR